MAKRLSIEEIKKYLIAYRQLNDQEALTQLVMSNRGLVYYFARKYINSGIELEDLISAGNEGLIKAINTINYAERELDGFASYISVAIENSIKNELNYYNKHKNVLSLSQPIGNSNDGEALLIEDIVGSDIDELVESVMSDVKNETIKDALKSLTSRERKVIILRYGLESLYKKTIEETAKIMGCSIKQINIIEQKALVKMRHPKNTSKLKELL